MAGTRTLFAVALGVSLLAARGDAQQKRAAALSPLDIIEIQQLAIRYSYGLDTGADNGTCTRTSSRRTASSSAGRCP